MSQSNRLIHLDVLKGLAIIFVIIHHGIDTPIIPEVIDSYHMPLFIFISGILSARELSFSWEKVKKYWKKKSLQLLLPLATILPLSVYVTGAADLSFFSRLMSTFAGGYKGGYWFVFALFILLLIQYLSRFIAAQAYKRGLQWKYLELAIMALPIPVLLAMRYIIPENIIELFSFYHISWLYPYLVLGFAVGKYQRLERCMLNEKLAGAFIVTYILGFDLIVNKANIMSLSMFPWCLFILIFTYASIYHFTQSASSNTSKRIISILSTLGQNSLGIYLLHKFFLPNLPSLRALVSLESDSSVVKYLVELPQQSLWAETLLAILVGFTTCSITYVAVCIVKNNRFLSRLFLGDV